MILILFISLFLLLTIIWSRRKYYLLKLKVPGKWGYPLLGSALSIRSSERVLDFLGEWKKKFGNFSCLFLGPNVTLLIYEPELLEIILTSTEFVDKHSAYNCVSFYSGDGLVTSKNPKWGQHRKLLNPTFALNVLKSFVPTYNTQVKILMGNFQNLVGVGAVDISQYILRCTSDTAFMTTMGINLNFQGNENDHIFKAFQSILNAASERMFQPWNYNDDIFRFSSIYKKNKLHHQNLIDLTKQIIEEKMQSCNSMESPSQSLDVNKIKKSDGFFINQAKKLYEQGVFDLNDILEESIVMMGASFDTISSALFFCLLSLARYPEYQEKLFDEIKEVFPEKTFDVSYDDIKQLKYMEMIINETLRLFPPIPIVGRTCSKDFNLNDKIIIPSGTQIGIDIFHLHRDEKIWGPDVLKFNPENFLKSNFERIHSYGFLPFTKGIRFCIGSRYAYLALKIMLSQIIRNFRFTTTENLEDLRFAADISLKLNKVPLIKIYERVM